MRWNVWFDDGDLSVYEIAFPLLKEKGITATVAIVTDYVGKNYPHYRVQPCPSMNIEQLKELIAAGWEIASHSLTHPHFTELTMKEAEFELAESKIWIIDNLDVTPTKFAFPAGLATPELIELAEQYYSHIRPIPPENHVDAIIHRVNLTPTGPQFDLAGEASSRFLDYIGVNPLETEALPESKWNFLVGCNNSGTTLLEYLMGQHPEVDLLKHEGHQIRVNGTRTPYPGMFIFPSPAVIGTKARLNRIWTEGLPIFRNIKTTPWVAKWAFMNSRRTHGGEYTLVKSQPFMLALPWFSEHFPDARFTVLVRNGYAVAEGNARRFNQRFPETPMSIRRAARHWRKAHDVMLRDLQQLKNYVVIRYEDLCLDPRMMMYKVFSDLGLPPHDYGETLSEPIPIFKGYRQEVKLKNMNPQSFSNLTEEDLDVIEEEAGALLKVFGYARPQLSRTQ